MNGETLLPELIVERLNPARQLLTAAVTGGMPLPACEHIDTHGPVATICAHHPATGLLCRTCIRIHALGHPAGLEHSCDVCGNLSGGGAIYAPGFDVASMPFARRAGDIESFTGKVVTVGLGACRSCDPVLSRRFTGDSRGFTGPAVPRAVSKRGQS